MKAISLKTHRTIFKVLLTSLIFSFCFGCNTIRKMTAEGGAEFVVRMETDEPNKEEVFQRAVSRMQNLSDALGAFSEVEKIPNSQNEVVVRIYKKEDVEQLKRLMFADFNLEFRKVISPPAPNPYASYPTEDFAKAVLKENQKALPFAENKSGYVIVEKANVITGDEIRDAKSVSHEATGDYAVEFSLNSTGANKFDEWTGSNLNNYLAVVINKKVVSVAAINSRISDKGQLGGRFTKQESEDIALSLKSGHCRKVPSIIGKNVLIFRTANRRLRSRLDFAETRSTGERVFALLTFNGVTAKPFRISFSVIAFPGCRVSLPSAS